MPDASARVSPMAPLLGAAPDVEPFAPLTPISAPGTARAALAAEADTKVVDPVGTRWLWVRAVHLLFNMVLLVLIVVVAVDLIVDDFDLGGVWLVVIPLLFLAQTGTSLLPAALCRTVPEPDDIPRAARARWRWYRALREGPGVVTPPAAWPSGAEAYALLSGAAGVSSVAPSWLCQQVGLPKDVGTTWVDSLRWQGWLAGGEPPLGLAWLPERHLQLTPTGRTRLEAERARLTALART